MVLMDVLLAAARLGAPTHPEALIASVEHPSPAPGGVTRGSRLFPGEAFGCRGRVVQSGPSGMKAPGRPGTVSSPGTRLVDSRVMRVQSGLYGWSGVSSRARRGQGGAWFRSDWGVGGGAAGGGRL